MHSQPTHPFDSIESAQEFMQVLEGVIQDVSGELREAARSKLSDRSLNGVRLAMFKVDQLAIHIGKSRRILNDLKLIRGVLASENASAASS